MLFGNNVLGPMPPEGPIRLWDAGVVWADLEKQKGVWDWSKLDGLINLAGTRSITLVLGHPPAWAAKGGPDGKQAAWMPAGSNRPPITAIAWRRYITEVVTRYKGRINNYQIWNEPVDKRFYSGELSELATITKSAYTLIKKLDPKAKVLSPPMQPRRQAGWSTKGKILIKELKSAGFPFDVYTMHIYPQKGEGIEGFVRDCKAVQNAIATCPKKPLWITEFNYNLGGIGNPYPIAQQNKLIIETEKACKMLDIPRAFWYAFEYNNPALIAITNT